MKQTSIDSIIENFDIANLDDSDPSKKIGVTFWIPEETKRQYDILQGETKRKAGKKIQEVLIQSIGRAFEKFQTKLPA